MKPSNPFPVKLIIAALYSDDLLFRKAKQVCADRFGRIDFESRPFEFDVTDYYFAEMGSPVFRAFISFEILIDPSQITHIKIKSNNIEDLFAVQGKRKVNLDAGYMDFDKLVLASAKYNWNKVYIGQGIWADITLHYEKGDFIPLPWGFPDFKSGKYNQELLKIRELYKLQRKNLSLF
jgi:hypothetical protein